MNDPIERLETEAARLDVARSGSRDGLYQKLAVAAMAVGLVGLFVAYQASLGSDDPRDIQSLIVLGMFLLALAVVGTAVFVRYSLARFLRFWLLRQLYEGQAHVDQLVEALRPGAASPAADGRTRGPAGSAGGAESGSAGLDADGVVADRNGGRGEDQLDAAGHASADLAHGQDAADPGAQDG